MIQYCVQRHVQYETSSDLFMCSHLGAPTDSYIRAATIIATHHNAAAAATCDAADTSQAILYDPTAGIPTDGMQVPVGMVRAAQGPRGHTLHATSEYEIELVFAELH